MKQILATLLAFFSLTAFAGPCEKGAQFVYGTAQVRDLGVSVEFYKEQVRMSEFNHPAIMQIIDIVYANPESPPQEIAQEFYAWCKKQEGDRI